MDETHDSIAGSHANDDALNTMAHTPETDSYDVKYGNHDRGDDLYLYLVDTVISASMFL